MKLHLLLLPNARVKKTKKCLILHRLQKSSAVKWLRRRGSDQEVEDDCVFFKFQFIFKNSSSVFFPFVLIILFSVGFILISDYFRLFKYFSPALNYQSRNDHQSKNVIS